MRILVIRGRNLASLEGEFEVDLEGGPLGRSGLFAITGPTGAGKSTLLDAVCLALYDCTPRLSGNGGPPIGRADDEERLRANDVRGILRRGAADGYAEVEFLGRDGRRWRSRWSVRRARGSPDGRIQAQALELLDVASGRVVGGTKTETLAAIEQRVGLDYQQFRRSALLAQGDFTAFLRANAPDRATLLERMTGTAIYGAISTQAYERAAEARRDLEVLLEQARGHVVLSDDDRAAMETESAARAGAVTNARLEVERTSGALRWHAARRRRATEENDAREARVRAEAAWEASAPERTAIALVEAALPLRPALRAADLRNAGAEQANARAVRTQDEVSRATEALAHARARAAETLAGADGATAALKAAQPALHEAARLDQAIAEARRTAEEARAAAEGADAASRRAEAERAAGEARRTAIVARLEQAAEWLAANAAIEPLARQWDRWNAAFRRHAEAAGAADAAERSLMRQEPALRRARAAHEAAIEARDRALAAREEARTLAEEAELRAGPAPDHREARAEHTSRRDDLVATRSAMDQARALAGRLHLRRAEQEVALRAAAEAGSEAEASAASRLRLAGALAEVERSLEEAAAIQGYDQRRATDLRKGRPCPLCGSKEHPWAKGGAPLTLMVGGLTARVAEIREDLAAADRTEAAARARRAERTRFAEEAASEIAAVERSLRELPAPASGLPGDLLAPELAEALGDELTRVDAALAEIDARDAAWKSASDAARAARAVADEAARRAESMAAAAHARERDAQEAAAALSATQVALAEHRVAVDRALGELAEAFPGSSDWRSALATAPEAFVTRCRAGKDAWDARIRARDDAARDLDDVARELAAAAERVENARRALSARATERETKESALATLVTLRAGYFEGRPTESVRSHLEGAVESAAAAHREADALHRAAATVLTEASTRHEEAVAQRTKAREEAAAAVAELDAGLADLGIDRDTLRERLATDEAALMARRTRVNALRKSLDDAHVVLAERMRQRAEHEAEAAPEGTEEDAPRAHEAAVARQQAEEDAAAAVRLKLALDDDARAHTSALHPRIAALRAASATWDTLADLIGSKDGKKFRAYAQGLTLDALLALANTHLADLAPRYRLTRVPGEDLDLQVIDRDLGDDIRSINSLSGGESFLTSLALALGLASLAARETQVDSIFIDEGFGTLDAGALEIALSTLDALQATGRKVGLISHVSGLAERIGALVRVDPVGGGRSVVSVTSAV